jgi:Putative adhesin
VSNGRGRRSSVSSGLLLIALGVILLLYRFEPGLHIGHLLRIYWPLLIIFWGILKLVDHVVARGDGASGAAPAQAGEVLLLIFAILVLAGYGFHDWLRTKYPDMGIDFGPFSQQFTRSKELSPQEIPVGAHVILSTGRGNITVHTGDENTLSVTANESARGTTESNADEDMNKVPVVIEKTKDGYAVHPVNQKNSDHQVDVDLDVEVPKSVSITATSDHGDISVAGIAGAISASTQKGDFDIHDSGSDVNIEMHEGDARISDVAGNVQVIGRGAEIEVSDVTGNATLEGDFFGPVHLRNITKTTHYTTPRDTLTLVNMTGRLELDSDSIQLSDVAGAANLLTHNRDLDVENVTGRLDIVDTHTSVTVRYSDPPRQDLNITNDSGSVDVTLPSSSNFEVAAASRGGEIDNDFETSSLKAVNEADTGKLNGKFGGPQGPKITITTSYGTIFLHKTA